MSDGPWRVVVEPIGNSYFVQGPYGAFLAQPETADAICRMLNAVFAAGAASQADRVKALEEALWDLLEDYDSIKFSCGHHALTGSVLEQARALLEERERQK